MDNTTLSLFIHELRNQCIYTEAAFRVFNQSLQEGASAGAFFAGQAILHSAGQIGAILWPTRARAKSRGETLRNALNLGKSHPLADRRLTSMWDFGDEKLEEWIFDTKGEQVIFDHLGPVPSAGEKALPDLNLYRLYDPTTQIFYFRGNGYKLQAIADAIADIFKRVSALHRQLLPDQYRPQPEGTAPEVKTGPNEPALTAPDSTKSRTDSTMTSSDGATPSSEPLSTQKDESTERASPEKTKRARRSRSSAAPPKAPTETKKARDSGGKSKKASGKTAGTSKKSRAAQTAKSKSRTTKTKAKKQA